MKINLLCLSICFFLFKVNAQEKFQSFPNEGFSIKCECKLYRNSTFIDLATQNGTKNIIAAFICAENQDSPEIGVINNINIYDESEGYRNIQKSSYDYFEKKMIESYSKNLVNAGIKYNYIIYKGVNAIEYGFSQQGIPTKAIYFIKNKKSYLIQVGTRNNLFSKYNLLKNSFEII